MRKYEVDHHTFDTEDGVQRYLNKRAENGWTLHSITNTGRLKDEFRIIIMYVWYK